MTNNKVKVLIIDESVESANLLKEDLKDNENLEVLAVSTNVEEALYLVKNNNIDVVISEIVLKGKDGFEFIEKAKEMKLNVKIIILSTLSHQGFIQKAMDLGADYYMCKPYDKDVITKRIFEVMNNDLVVENSDKKRAKNMEEKITNIFITVGIPAHLVSFGFLAFVFL